MFLSKSETIKELKAHTKNRATSENHPSLIKVLAESDGFNFNPEVAAIFL
jgi:hypothetical protein